jgi:hypothetical protein
MGYLYSTARGVWYMGRELALELVIGDHAEGFEEE